MTCRNSQVDNVGNPSLAIKINHDQHRRQNLWCNSMMAESFRRIVSEMVLCFEFDCKSRSQHGIGNGERPLVKSLFCELQGFYMSRVQRNSFRWSETVGTPCLYDGRSTNMAPCCSLKALLLYKAEKLTTSLLQCPSLMLCFPCIFRSCSFL